MEYQVMVDNIREAILYGLTSREEAFRQIGTHPIGCSRVNGIAVSIIPFFDTFSIHLRDSSDERNTDFINWKHAHFYDITSDDRTLLDTIIHEYENCYDEQDDNVGLTANQYMVKLNTATADALMSDEVIAILKTYKVAQFKGVDGLRKVRSLAGSLCQFVVIDVDEVLNVNFCEIIRWRHNFFDTPHPH